MGKIRRIYETTQEINFLSPQKEFLLNWKSFQESELGGIYQAIVDGICQEFKNQIKQKRTRSDIQSSGNSSPDVFKILCGLFRQEADQLP